MAKDIPMILMNMSCMNANVISQSKTIDVLMKQLFYGLESLPTELLFSDCTRLGRYTADAWIPREIAHESFAGRQILKLRSTGFAFETRKNAQALSFYLLSSAHPSDRFQLLLPAQKGAKSLNYNIEDCRDQMMSYLLHPQVYGALLLVMKGRNEEHGLSSTELWATSTSSTSTALYA